MKRAPHWLCWLLRKIGQAAITLPPFGIYAVPERRNDMYLTKHELVHWEQYKRMGAVMFYLTYLWYQIRYGYKHNPMEIEARGRSGI